MRKSVSQLSPGHERLGLFYAKGSEIAASQSIIVIAFVQVCQVSLLHTEPHRW